MSRCWKAVHDEVRFRGDACRLSLTLKRRPFQCINANPQLTHGGVHQPSEFPARNHSGYLVGT